MIARELPQSEWHRLDGTFQQDLVPQLTDQCRVIVVEDNGKIIAGWSLLTVQHAECLFVSDEHRNALLPLLRCVRKTAESMGVHHFVSGTDLPSVVQMIEDFDGTELLHRYFLIDVAKLPESRM